jgi:hypothetical protein
MFTKIPNSFLNLSIDWFQFKSDVVVDQYYSNARKAGSTFYAVKNLTLLKEQILKNIFKIQPNNCFFAEFTGSGLVTPHTDGGGDTVALNLYLDAVSNDETIYYRLKPHAVPYPASSSYNVDDLTEISKFTAKQYDTYLLDVSKIHGIQKYSNNVRSMITFRWKTYYYQDILRSLNLND